MTKPNDTSSREVATKRYRRLTPGMVARITVLKDLLDDAYPKSIEEWVEGFDLDWFPGREIYIWECIAFTYASLAGARDFSLKARGEMLDVLNSHSLGEDRETILNHPYKCLAISEVKNILDRYATVAKLNYMVNQHRRHIEKR